MMSFETSTSWDFGGGMPPFMIVLIVIFAIILIGVIARALLSGTGTTILRGRLWTPGW